MPGDVVAITVDQPYASLIAHGIKEWETRPYPPAGWPGIPEGQRRMPGVRVEPGQEVLIVSNRPTGRGGQHRLAANHLPVCLACHAAIHSNPLLARRLGLLVGEGDPEWLLLGYGSEQ